MLGVSGEWVRELAVAASRVGDGRMGAPRFDVQPLRHELTVPALLRAGQQSDLKPFCQQLDEY
jgi:hypothetical protein